MKNKLNELYWRVRYLITRRLEWETGDGEINRVEKVPFRVAWKMFGIRSHRWSWVRRYGRLRCGCTRNPITRRMVLYAWRCPEHFPKLPGEDES